MSAVTNNHDGTYTATFTSGVAPGPVTITFKDGAASGSTTVNQAQFRSSTNLIAAPSSAVTNQGVVLVATVVRERNGNSRHPGDRHVQEQRRVDPGL